MVAITETETSDAAPPQPPSRGNSASKPQRDDLSGSYAPLRNGTADIQTNLFELFDAELDDAGADAGRWEAEAVGARSEARPWQPRFYSAYFDINAGDLFVRLLRSIIPYKPLLGWADYEEEEGGGTAMPDLYGPVWVTTTAVLALAVGSSVATFLHNVFHGAETAALEKPLASLNFTRLWKAASLLYFYVFIFPVLLFVFQYLFVRRSIQQSSVSAHPVLGTVMVYGYSMTAVVLASFVATVPMRFVQMLAMACAFSIGVVVIMLNLWRDVSVEHRSLTYFVRLVAALAHLGVGVALVYLFFVTR